MVLETSRNFRRASRVSRVAREAAAINTGTTLRRCRDFHLTGDSVRDGCSCSMRGIRRAVGASCRDV